jgi:phosphoenolpyruvate-protein kinase (PTS system EI component)
MFASEKSRIVTTCAAAFIDVRTGYVYGVAEGSATQTRHSSIWTTERTIDAARLKTEREALSAALKEVARTWSGIYAQYNVTTAGLR